MQSKNNIFTVLGLWVVLFTVFGGAYKTPFGNLSTSHISLIWGLTLLSVYLSQNQLWRVEYLLGITKRYYYYLFIMLLLFIISAIQFVFFDTGEPLFLDLQLKRVMQAAISFFFFAITADYVISRLSPEKIFFGLFLFLIGVLLFSVCQLTNESFRMWFLGLTAIDGYWLEWAQKSNRAIGLKAMSIWDTSVSYALLIFVAFAVFFQGIRRTSILWLYLFVFLIFILVVISGRTGLLFLTAFFCLLAANYKKYSLIITFSILAVFGVCITIALTQSELILRVTSFAFELILNILQGKIETNSTDDLLNNHLFMPHINNFLFGDNFFIGDGDEVESKIGRSSDSAFVINYVAYGLTGVFFTLLLVMINAKIIFGYFNIKAKTCLYYFVFLACLILSLGLYVKILVYVSATLLKAMIFVTICTHHITLNKYNELRKYNET